MAAYFTVICIIKSNHARSRVNTHALTLMELSNGLPIIVDNKEDDEEEEEEHTCAPTQRYIVGHFYGGTN